MVRKNHHGTGLAWWAGCACLALGTAAFGQVIQPMGALQPTHGHHQQQAANQPAPSLIPLPVSTSTPSMLDKPAQPAKVDLAAQHLSIQADNSSLTQILQQVTTASGMTVEGLAQDQRIFGSYGPGDPQDVLSSLLRGMGYNVVMVGETATGTPKQLLLSPRGATAVSSAPRTPSFPSQEEDSDDEVQAQPMPELPAPPQGNLPQGAPNQTGAPQNGGVRTPQQMLQELQQIRQMQQQQMQQQQQPQQ